MHAFQNSAGPPGKRREGYGEKVSERESEAVSRRFDTGLEPMPELSDEEFMAEFGASDEEYDRGLTVVLPWNRASVPGNNEEEQ